MLFDSTSEASRFLLDGSIQALFQPSKPNSNVNIKYTQIYYVTPCGYAIGDSVIPGTIGSAPAQWTPEGTFSFILGNGVVTSSRDRNDGQGINVGFYEFDPTIKLGDNYYYIQDMNGEHYDGSGGVLVSQSDFAIVQDWAFPANKPKYAFFPGIVPGFPDRAVKLLNIFPELATVDIDVIHDLASVDGYLYMTLSGSDGTFLFGARDPSVIVPEPATAVLMLLGGIACASRGRRR